MIVARLHPVAILLAGDRRIGVAKLAHRPNRNHWNARTQKLRQRQLLRLKRRIGTLHAKRDPKAVAFRSIESQTPHRIEVESAGPLLHVAPVAANIEHIDKRKAGHLLHVVFQGLAAFSHGDGRTFFLPGITKQPKPRVAERLLRGRGIQNSLPAFVLIDIERTLLQAILGCKSTTEAIALPKMPGDLGKRMDAGHQRH